MGERHAESVSKTTETNSKIAASSGQRARRRPAIPSALVETQAPIKAAEPPEQIPPRPSTPPTSRPEPAVETPQPIKVEPPVQPPVDPKNEPVNKLYWNKSMSGKMAFDFSKNKKCCAIGEVEHLFEVRWSTCTKTKVYVYNDPPSLEGVAIARGVTDPRKIREASKLDFWERSREAALGSLVVLKNRHGKYAVLRITKIVDSYRIGAPNDWLEFDYFILPDGDDFSRMK